MPDDEDEAWATIVAMTDGQARQAATDAFMHERRAAIQQAEVDLIAELRAAGVNVHATWDLVRDRWAKMDLVAADILIRRFDSIGSVHLRKIIGQALEAKVVGARWDEVAALYRSEPHPSVRERLASALALNAGAKQLPGLLELARDRTRGSSRVLLVPRIRRLAREQASEILTKLAADPDLEKESRFQLARLKQR